MRPHRWQPTRFPRSWDSPGKNTGVGCHFLLQCVKVKSESKVTQSCPTLSDPMDYSLPGSSVHGIFQARVLEWGAIAFSLAFSMIQQMLAIWSLVLLPFLNPDCTSGSSQFTYLLRPSLKDVECSLTSMSHECSCTAVCTFSGTALLWDWNENTYLFQSCGHYWVF